MDVSAMHMSDGLINAPTSAVFFVIAALGLAVALPRARRELDERTAPLAGLVAAVVVAALLFIWRPLTFASADPDLAEARGVPVRVLSIVFMFLLGLAVALSIQVVGALLVLSLLITPSAAALLVTSSPRLVVLLSVVFAVTSAVGGILLALGGRISISPYITTISFLIYLACRLIKRSRTRGRVRAGAVSAA